MFGGEHLMIGPSATATPTAWEVRYHASDGSVRVLAAGSADGILDSLRKVADVSRLLPAP